MLGDQLKPGQLHGTGPLRSPGVGPNPSVRGPQALVFVFAIKHNRFANKLASSAKARLVGAGAAFGTLCLLPSSWAVALLRWTACATHVQRAAPPLLLAVNSATLRLGDDRHLLWSVNGRAGPTWCLVGADVLQGCSTLSPRAVHSILCFGESPMYECHTMRESV